jgi:hypothetical protein
MAEGGDEDSQALVVVFGRAVGTVEQYELVTMSTGGCVVRRLVLSSSLNCCGRVKEIRTSRVNATVNLSNVDDVRFYRPPVDWLEGSRQPTAKRAVSGLVTHLPVSMETVPLGSSSRL